MGPSALFGFDALLRRAFVVTTNARDGSNAVDFSDEAPC
jgi:hypothetical protein